MLADPCCLTDFGSNPGIRELPAELGRLSNLWQLDIEDLNITNVPQDVRKEGRSKCFLIQQVRQK